MTDKSELLAIAKTARDYAEGPTHTRCYTCLETAERLEALAAHPRDDVRELAREMIADRLRVMDAAKQPDDVREGGFLDTLRQVNGERAEAWAEGRPSDPLFWAIELGGEVGEILNVVKKLRREEIGWRGSRATLADLSDEIADGLICLDSLARHYGIDLAEATARKFNKTSEKVGLPHRIDTALAPTTQPDPWEGNPAREGMMPDTQGTDSGLADELEKAIPLLEDLETGQDCEDYAYAKGRGFQAMTYCPEAFEALRCIPRVLTALRAKESAQ